MFAVRDYQAGNIIEVFDTHEEAVECLKAFESRFYEVAEIGEEELIKLGML